MKITQILIIFGLMGALFSTVLGDCQYYRYLTEFLGTKPKAEVAALCLYDDSMEAKQACPIKYRNVLLIQGTSEEKQSCQGAACWSLSVSQSLADYIARCLNPNKLNIRRVHQKDNLGRIVDGLTRHEVSCEDEQSCEQAWTGVAVEYLGDSEQIQQQRHANPQGDLFSAATAHANQYVVLLSPTGSRDKPTLLVADRIDALCEELAGLCDDAEGLE